MKIPKKMNNEESKIFAAVIVEERNFAIAKCKLDIAEQALANYRFDKFCKGYGK